MRQVSTKHITKLQHPPTGFSGAGFDSNHAHWAGDRKPLAPGAKANEGATPGGPAAPGTCISQVQKKRARERWTLIEGPNHHHQP